MELNKLTAKEMAELKKLRVNLEMVGTGVSIIDVTLSTVEYCQENGHAYDVKSIVSLIRKNRETSTTITHPEQVTFNPSLIVVGTNSRTFPLYYHQFCNEKLSVYVPAKQETGETKEETTNVSFSPETVKLEQCQPEFLLIEHKPETLPEPAKKAGKGKGKK